MQQAYGIVYADGGVRGGSGNFSVQKMTDAGNYWIAFDGVSSDTVPVVVVTPFNTSYTTANAVIETFGGGGVRVLTGFTDQSHPIDCGFTFHAFWP